MPAICPRAHEVARLRGYDGLEVQHELVVLGGGPQLLLQVGLLPAVDAQLGTVVFDLGPVRGGALQGRVRTREQLLVVARVLGVDRDADARAQRQGVRPDGQRLGQVLADAPGDAGDGILVADLGEQDQELVGGHAGEGVALARDLAQAVGGRAQHLVSRGPAVLRAERAEALEIDVEERGRLRVTPGQGEGMLGALAEETLAR